MKSMNRPAILRRRRVAPADEQWRERSARLYVEIEPAARAMLRRGFSGFGEHELEDIYANAWVGALRALATRHHELDDDQVRRYILAAVANQASKEIRRRKRKPSTSLEPGEEIIDTTRPPDERAAVSEQQRITRDLLTSLPPRRRAVMLLRYGWGLDPDQVCSLITGLSPRAYRKEITRGVDELTAKLRQFEAGEWCAEREPLLKAVVAGVADDDERRQAQAHLSHCRECSKFVARLTGRLHDLGGAVSLPLAFGAVEGSTSLGERAGATVERARDAITGLLSRSDDAGIADVIAKTSASGGGRGGGVASAGVVAKLAGLGSAGKAAIACVTGGAAATACVAAVAPSIGITGDADRERRPDPGKDQAIEREAAAVAAPVPDVLPVQIGHQESPGSRGGAEHAAAALPDFEPEAEPVNEEPPAPAPPVDPATAPVEREFGVAAAAAADVPASSGPTSQGQASGGGGGGGSPAAAARREFGP